MFSSANNVFNKIFHHKREKRRKLNNPRENYPQYQIGRGTYGPLKVHSWGEGATLRMGAFCSIAPGVQIFLGGEHRIDWVTTFPFNVLWAAGSKITGHPHTKGDVEIGNDVWIGTEALIMSGVTIGDGAVIGARAVVTKNVLPYSVVVGSPAVVIKKRFDDRTIERLLAVKWWDWDDSRIEKALPMLLSNDIKTFLETVEAEK
jgi:acetyltransferase-like isoleucine patch superfamily enzyme